MPDSPVRHATVLAVVALLALAGCDLGSTPPPTPGGGVPSASTATTRAHAASGPTASAPTFKACGRAPADASRTNLRPSALTDADRALAGAWADVIPDGKLVVEAAAEFDVQDGFLGAGNGYLASIGEPEGMVQVADGTVGAAPVSLAVLDSPSSGRRVAFVEIRLESAPPVRWIEQPDLGIGTDGGDGGFLALGSSPEPLNDEAASTAVKDSFDAYFPEEDDYSTWNQCLVRSTNDRVDGVLFSTGWGDGYFPTYLGKDADGDVVSVVSFGGVIPWNLSGLPGEAPPAEEVGP